MKLILCNKDIPNDLNVLSEPSITPTTSLRKIGVRQEKNNLEEGMRTRDSWLDRMNCTPVLESMRKFKPFNLGLVTEAGAFG